jgi:maleate isomerase
MLTPSSNTVLEPITYAMLAGLPEVSAHFSRFRVTEIALSLGARAQFDDSAIMRAADLPADARVDVIGWNGTSAGWLGVDSDLRLCERIQAAMGIPAMTSILALNAALAARQVTRLALVTPYLDEVQERIIANYRAIGIDCVAERHFGLQDNFSFCTVDETRIGDSVEEVARAAPQVIATICTNLRAAPLVARLERDIGLPVFDSISTVTRECLAIVGIEPGRVRGWGRLFEEPI